MISSHLLSIQSSDNNEGDQANTVFYFYNFQCTFFGCVEEEVPSSRPEQYVPAAPATVCLRQGGPTSQPRPAASGRQTKQNRNSSATPVTI